MILILTIVGIIFGITWFFYALWDCGCFCFEAFAGLALIPTLGFALGTLLSLLLSLFAACFPQVPASELQVIELQALKDNDEIYGSFFIGSGTINKKQYYYYLTETPKGVQQQKIEANHNVYLNYTKEGDTPRIEVQKFKCGNELLHFLSHGMGDYSEYYIYIPEGSIAHEFSIDLE